MGSFRLVAIVTTLILVAAPVNTHAQETNTKVLVVTNGDAAAPILTVRKSLSNCLLKAKRYEDCIRIDKVPPQFGDLGPYIRQGLQNYSLNFLFQPAASTSIFPSTLPGEETPSISDLIKDEKWTKDGPINFSIGGCGAVDPMPGFTCVSLPTGGVIIVPVGSSPEGAIIGDGIGYDFTVQHGALTLLPNGNKFLTSPAAGAPWDGTMSFNLVEMAE